MKVIPNQWSDNVYHIENPGQHDLEDSRGWGSRNYTTMYLKNPPGERPLNGWRAEDYSIVAVIDIDDWRGEVVARKYNDAGKVSAWTTYRVEGVGSARKVVATGDSAW